MNQTGFVMVEDTKPKSKILIKVIYGTFLTY